MENEKQDFRLTINLTQAERDRIYQYAKKLGLAPRHFVKMNTISTLNSQED